MTSLVSVAARAHRALYDCHAYCRLAACSARANKAARDRESASSRRAPSPTPPGIPGAYQGLQQIRDSLGLAISHVEARTPSEQEEALRTYAAQGYDLVFAHGFEFQDPAERVSAQYPKTIFIVTSGRRAKGNVAPLIFRLEEASYLAGMVAGGLTRSDMHRLRRRHRAAADRGGLPGLGQRGPGGQPQGPDAGRSTSTASTTRRPAGRPPSP